MITTDDIAGVVLARTAAVSAFVSAVPGKAWLDRGPDTPDSPTYAVFTVEAGEAKVASGSAYVQPFKVRVGVYAPVGDSGVNIPACQQALFTCFGTAVAQAALQGAALRNAAEHVLHARPLAPDGKFDATLRQGRDVFVSGFAFELLCQGTRGAA